jgi:acetyl esterase/lipase
MSPGAAFTEKYLKLMFKSLRDATPEQVEEELEHCRRENRRTVRVPRYFRSYFTPEIFTTSTGYVMQYFHHVHQTARPLSLSKGRPKRKLIFYNHGGAFIYPPVFFHWRFMHDISLRSHCDILMPVYPKSPEYTCKDTVSSLLEFYHEIVEKLDYDEIHFMGDSAGAHLSLVIAQEAVKNGWRKPKSLILNSPCLDLSHSAEATMRNLQKRDPMLQLDRVILLNRVWQGDLPVTHPWVSPYFGDFSGLDNLNVFYGTDEILKADVLLLKEKLEKEGLPATFHEYEGMFHTFPMFPVRQGFAAIREMVKVIK